MPSRFAQMADAHYKRWLPNLYAQIKDRPTYFENLADEAENQINDLADALAGPNLPGEPFPDRIARLSLAQSNAQAAVIRELILPEPPETEDQQTPGDQELAEAVQDFHDAMNEAQPEP